MFMIGIFQGIYLKIAVEAISKFADNALMVFNNEELGIQVFGEWGQSHCLVAALQLHSRGCSDYFFPTGGYVCISLRCFQGILSQATDQDSVTIYFAPYEIQGLSVEVVLQKHGNEIPRRFPLEVIPLTNALATAYNAIENINEAHYRVTVGMSSVVFRSAIMWLGGIRGPNNPLTGLLRSITPVQVHLTWRMLVFHLLVFHLLGFHLLATGVILMREIGNFYVHGATQNDQFNLTFRLGDLISVMEAASMLHWVFIHAGEGRRPLLRCPFGEGLGNLFFIGYQN